MTLMLPAAWRQDDFVDCRGKKTPRCAGMGSGRVVPGPAAVPVREVGFLGDSVVLDPARVTRELGMCRFPLRARLFDGPRPDRCWFAWKRSMEAEGVVSALPLA